MLNKKVELDTKQLAEAIEKSMYYKNKRATVPVTTNLNKNGITDLQPCLDQSSRFINECCPKCAKLFEVLKFPRRFIIIDAERQKLQLKSYQKFRKTVNT